MTTRRLLDQFELPNIGYAGCAVTIYVADAVGMATAVKAALYDSLTGAGTLLNPQTFTSEGALQAPTYIDVPVVPIITGAHAASQTLGVICPPGGARGDWATATLYLPGDIVVDGVAGTGTENIYAVVNLHQSGVWATDSVNAAKLKIILDVAALSIAPDATTSVKGKIEIATNAELLTGTDATRAATPDNVAALWEAGADNAGGATITMDAGGRFKLITSTTAITAFAFTTDKAGRTARLRFNTIRTLTYNATSLIIPGAANVTTAVGDTCVIESLGSGNFEVIRYTRADGTALVAPSTTTPYSAVIIDTVASVSGTTLDFTTAGHSATIPVTNGFRQTIVNSAASSDVTVTPASGTIDTLATRKLRPGDRVTVTGTGGNLKTISGEYSYDSGDQTITTSGALSLAHGLGVIPKRFECEMVLTGSTELNYTTNDRVAIPIGCYENGGSNQWGITPDATNLNLRYGSSVPALPDKTTGSITNVTAASWKLRIRAFAR